MKINRIGQDTTAMLMFEPVLWLLSWDEQYILINCIKQTSSQCWVLNIIREHELCMWYYVLSILYEYWSSLFLFYQVLSIKMIIHWLQNASKNNWSSLVMIRLVYDAMPPHGFMECIAVWAREDIKTCLFVLCNVYDHNHLYICFTFMQKY